jgi:hypothetical protein
MDTNLESEILGLRIDFLHLKAKLGLVTSVKIVLVKLM